MLISAKISKSFVIPVQQVRGSNQVPVPLELNFRGCCLDSSDIVILSRLLRENAVSSNFASHAQQSEPTILRFH